jgi:hypothetical protein
MCGSEFGGRTRSHASSFSSTLSGGAASSASGMPSSTRSLSPGTVDGGSPWPKMPKVWFFLAAPSSPPPPPHTYKHTSTAHNPLSLFK